MGTSIVEPKALGRKGVFTRLRLIYLFVVFYLCCIAMARVGPVNTKRLLYADFAAVTSIEPVVYLASGDSTFVYLVEQETDRSFTLNPKNESNQKTHGWALSSRITSFNVFNAAPVSRVFTGTVVIRDLTCQQFPDVGIVGMVERVAIRTGNGANQNLTFDIKIESKQSKNIFLIIDGSCVGNQLIEILSVQITW